MHSIHIRLLKIGCMLGHHQYGPWKPSSSSPLTHRDCVRCGTRQHRDSDDNTVQSQFVDGVQNVNTLN